MKRYLIPVALLALSVPVLAADVESGPAKGAKVPALKVHDVTGANKDKEVDYTALRKGAPTFYLLLPSDKFSRPMNRFMKKLDEAVKKDFADTYGVAVWLTDDLGATKDRLARVQMSVQYESTALTCFKGKDGPADWTVNTDAHLTVVLAVKGRVVQRWGYNSVNDTDVPAVVAALRKARGK